MTYYHGSKRKLDVLVPQQAEAGEGLMVPEGELLKAIYLTPNREYAIAMAARPDGVTHIDTEQNRITFDQPEAFNPEQEIFIYEVDLDGIAPEHIRRVDDLQTAVVDIPEITPSGVQELKAGEVEQYYELTNWKREGGMGQRGDNLERRV
jgi:hypothetical protein